MLVGGVVVGGVSAIAAGLYSLGIPEDSILQYETVRKAGKFVLIVHGTAAEATRARTIICRTNPEALEEHRPLRVTPEVLAELQPARAMPEESALAA